MAYLMEELFARDAVFGRRGYDGMESEQTPKKASA